MTVPTPIRLDPDSERKKTRSLAEQDDEEDEDASRDEYDFNSFPAVPRASVRRHRKRTPVWMLIFMYLTSVAVAVLIFLAIRHYVFKQPLPEVLGFLDPRSPSNHAAPNPPQNTLPQRQPQRQPQPVMPRHEPTHEPGLGDLQPVQPPGVEPASPDVVTGNTPSTIPTTEPKPEPEPEPKLTPVVKSPVPSDAELAASRDIIKEVFGDQMKEARSAEEKIALAESLISTAATTEDPVKKYALIQQAHDLALEARSLPHCDVTVEKLVESFTVDRPRLWRDTLTKLLGNQADEATVRQVADADLAAATDPTKRRLAADAWYDLSKKLGPKHNPLAKERALLHYQAALPILTGMEKLKAEKRIEELR